eukprot:3028589-Rhodomonas_salina.1
MLRDASCLSLPSSMTLCLLSSAPPAQDGGDAENSEHTFCTVNVTKICLIISLSMSTRSLKSCRHMEFVHFAVLAKARDEARGKAKWQKRVERQAEYAEWVKLLKGTDCQAGCSANVPVVVAVTTVWRED